MNIPLGLVRDRTVLGHAHDDITVTVGSYVRRSDSCYFGLEARNQEAATVDSVIVAMLDQWLSDLRLVTVGGPTVYFPVDFSDECSGWVATDTEVDGSVNVEFGWTYLEGWAFMPTEYADSVNDLRGWQAVDESRFECELIDPFPGVMTGRSSG